MLMMHVDLLIVPNLLQYRHNSKAISCDNDYPFFDNRRRRAVWLRRRISLL